jgi:hypothetical protein
MAMVKAHTEGVGYAFRSKDVAPGVRLTSNFESRATNRFSGNPTTFGVCELEMDLRILKSACMYERGSLKTIVA